MEPILVCAATGTEAAACQRGIRDAGLSEHFEVLRTGVGLAFAESNLKRRLQQAPLPRMIVSSGFAGALSSSIARYAWITAKSVAWAEKALPLAPTAIRVSQLKANHNGALSCHVISSASLVEQTWQVGPLLEQYADPVAVDMESSALAEIAANQNIPFMVLRMITDTPDAPLPKFVSAFAIAMTRRELGAKLALGIEGIKQVWADPKGVAYLVKNGKDWASRLRSGWRQHAQALVERGVS